MGNNPCESFYSGKDDDKRFFEEGEEEEDKSLLVSDLQKEEQPSFDSMDDSQGMPKISA